MAKAHPDAQNDKSAPPPAPRPPDKYKVIYEGAPLPAFYAAEMIRPYIGRTLWIMDRGLRVRNGELKDVPNVREDQTDVPNPATFVDERPLYLREIIFIALYEPPR